MIVGINFIMLISPNHPCILFMCLHKCALHEYLYEYSYVYEYGVFVAAHVHNGTIKIETQHEASNLLKVDFKSASIVLCLFLLRKGILTKPSTYE